ncbi:hypothetical protein [Salinibacterium sp. ZJ77]|uniref:hypothetical protein n=1 Tax=Salinibacterium sp. ZJ77 TaxID=2708337 RepID=UPI0014204BD3|nr:hypothetical protein [Salinibacterium sp. ZJ77]
MVSVQQRQLDGEQSRVDEPPAAALVRDLHALRIAAGTPSFTDLADAVSQTRAARGMLPAAARVARSSVYDLFRPDRKRVNPELVADVVRALGHAGDTAEQWRSRAAAANAGQQIPPSAPDDAASPAPEGGAQAPAALFAVVLCIAAVGINHALNFTATAAGLPIYLDMVGTAFAAFAFGPAAGIGVGVATNLIGNLMNGDMTGAWFAIVQIVGAVIWGVGFRRWFGRSWPRFALLNAVAALACTLTAVPIILFAFGGASSLEGVDLIGQQMLQLGLGFADAVVSANLLTSIVDKMLSGCAALGAVLLLARFGYGFPCGVNERLRELAPRRSR